MSSKRYALLLEYDGTDYAGWQRQNNARSVQGTAEKALSKMIKTKIHLYGCSRTDAGVHARGHVSHFDADCKVPTERIPLALASLLPPDISCLAAAEVPPDFHARFDPVGKQYSYYIWNHRRKSALLHRYTEQEGRPLDLAAMREAAALLVGRHDFRGFMASGSTSKITVRHIHKLEISGESGGLIRIQIAGDGFLYNMVRIIAGTLMYIGLGKLEQQDLQQMLEKGDRTLGGKTLGPQGLFLDKVFYRKNPFGACYNIAEHMPQFLKGREEERK